MSEPSSLVVREATRHDLEAVLALQREDSFHSFSEPDHVSSNQRRAEAHRFYERLGYEPIHVGMKKYLT